MSIALKRGLLLLRYHIHLTAYVFIFLLLDSIHAFQTEVRWLDVCIRPLVNCLIACNLVLLHGRTKSTLRTFWPFIFHLLKLVLTGKFIKVAVRVADLVPVRSVPWNPIRSVLTLSVDDILGQTLFMERWIVAISDIHQFLYQLLFSYLLAINKFLQ